MEKGQRGQKGTQVEIGHRGGNKGHKWEAGTGEDSAAGESNEVRKQKWSIEETSDE